MRKRIDILYIALIAACLAVFFGYRMLDSMKTDTTAPEITVDGQLLKVSVWDADAALLQGVTARDKRDGDVTDSVLVESVTLQDGKGNLLVKYAAFDKSGNVAKAQREARYTDYESPKFTMSQPLVYRYGSTFDVLSAVGATDVVDGSIQHRVRAMAMSDQSIGTVGIHEVEFQVTNSLGDTVTAVFPVEVYNSDLYDAELTLTSYLVYQPKGKIFRPEAYLEEFILRGEKTDLTGGMPKGYELEIRGGVQIAIPGVYPVEYRVTYTLENELSPERSQTFTGYSKLIVIVEG